MKRLFGIITALSLAAVIATGLTACGNNNKNGGSKSETSTRNFEYTLNSDKESYTLSGYSISAEAKTLADKNDYEKLAELFNKTLKEGETEFTAETARTFTVPATYKDLPVTKIATNALANLGYIKKLVVTSAVKEIGQSAFSGLSSLEEIELPFVGAKDFGYLDLVSNKKCFGYIFGTSEATGLTSCAQVYNDNAASTSYYVPSTLKKVTVTGSNKKLGSETIKYEIIDGKKVETDKEEGTEGVYTDTFDTYSFAVQPYAFYGCTTIENIVLSGETVEKIWQFTFKNCSSLKSFEFPATTAEVGEGAFDDCSALTTVDFGSVTTIGKEAFKHCNALGKTSFISENPSITLTAVTDLGDNAFEGCTSLVSVKFAASGAITIGKEAFLDCSSLSKIEGADSATTGADWIKGTKIDS